MKGDAGACKAPARTTSRREESLILDARRLRVSATLRAVAVGQLCDLPGATDLAEHERVHATVAELFVQVERVIRPNLGKIGVDTYLWIEDPLVPDITGLGARDGRGKSCRRRERDGGSTAGRHADEARRRIEDLAQD